MGKTALHEAAERGDSDNLQLLLDEGTYDVNEGSDGSGHFGVWMRDRRE